MSNVSGLQAALRLCASDKVKDRSQGQELVREIFSNRENLRIFQETASRDGGAGWIAFFQCLFQVVVVEKKAAVKKGASGQADRRLAEAISLVRWMAERSVHLISRKPFLALYTHMTHLLVFSSTIFPPAALDYAKALRTLLSYPPHLENLDQQGWKILTGICWTAVLGDQVTVDEDWQDDAEDEADLDMRKVATDMATQAASGSRQRSTVTQATNELVLLIPILLSSTAAPLIPPLPPIGPGWVPEPSLGLSILLKIHRFFLQHPTETSAHLPILRSLNTVLTELELNCRSDFVTGGIKLFPQLVSLWGTRNKGIREQVLIALRTLFPHMTHRTAIEKDRAGDVREAMTTLMDALPREIVTKGGIRPLDLGVLRLRCTVDQLTDRQPFGTRTCTIGFDFNHESAMTWAVLELYAEICYELYRGSSVSPLATPSRTHSTPSTQSGPNAKKRRVDGALVNLVRLITRTSPDGQIIALSVLNIFVDRHWDGVHSEAQTDIRQTLLACLGDDNTAIQSWAFVALATIAAQPASSSAPTEGEDWSKVWAHAIRKTSIAPVSRAACHTGNIIMCCGKIAIPSSIKEISTFLSNVDIQGPPYPFDSVCAFLRTTLRIAQQDVRLYAMGFEDKVLAWLGKWDALEGLRGKGRLDPSTPSELFSLINDICRLPPASLSHPTSIDCLPDCAIVDHALKQAETRAMRDFVLYGRMATPSGSYDLPAPSISPVIPTREHHTFMPLDGRSRTVSRLLLRQLQLFCDDWAALENPSASPPERIRRAIDLVVLVLAFQASLERGDIQSDQSGHQLVTKLLKLLQPALASRSYPFPAQNLMWQGFEPLLPVRRQAQDIWPIILQAGVRSGIRQDVSRSKLAAQPGSTRSFDTGPSAISDLPSLVGRSAAPGSAEWPQLSSTPGFNPLQGLPSSLSVSLAGSLCVLSANMAPAFKEIFETCRGHLEQGHAASQPLGSQAPIAIADDDDFGEIRTAETEAMPQSKEVIECQRTTSSLLSMMARFRLCGMALNSTGNQPPKDTPLINAFLSAEGTRFVQLGNVICSSIREGSLSLNLEALDLIVAAFEEMLSSYAYSRDEGLVSLALSFMTCSAQYWLAPEYSTADVSERVTYLARFLATKVGRDQVSAWRSRLAILVFVDEYLDYDPSFSAWTALHMDDDSDEDAWGPLSVIAGGLMDRDARVRFRSATSAAALFYLESIPRTQHLAFYETTMNLLPRQPKHWDSFITDLLWKLNCCVTSAQLRTAAIYHLYEIPLSTSDFNFHLQHGLEAVSRQLGLDGIASLYLPHAALVIRSQLGVDQSPMRVPYRLYGSSSHKSFATSLLNAVAPSILAAIQGEVPDKDGRRGLAGARELFVSLCEAAGVDIASVVSRQLPSVLAIVYANLAGLVTRSPRKVGNDPIHDAIKAIPGFSETETDALLKGSGELAGAALFELLNLDQSRADTESLLTRTDPSGRVSATFACLVTNGVNSTDPQPVLHPSFPPGTVLQAYGVLRTAYPSISPGKIVFAMLTGLFYRINNTFLVSEQHRYISSIALVTALHHAEFCNPVILELFLRETIALLDKPDVTAIAVSYLEWGFQQVSMVTQPLRNLSNLLLQLGSAWERVSRLGTAYSILSSELERVISAALVSWQQDKTMREVLTIAMTLWPARLAGHLKDWPAPIFGDLCELASMKRVDDPSTLLTSMRASVTEGDLEVNVADFQQRAFWHIKDRIKPASLDPPALTAFLDLLYFSSGQISAPKLEALKGLSTTDPQYDDLVARHKKEPMVFVRVVIVDKAVRLTTNDDFRARATGLRVLRTILPYISDLRDRGALSPAVISISELLVAAGSPLPSVPSENLNHLRSRFEDDTLVRTSKNLTDWASVLAETLCNELAVGDPFYSGVVPLLTAATSNGADLLPFLVQACLSDSMGTSKEVQERARLLSNHLSVVLRYPSASTQTVRTIVDIVLHLRHFPPPTSTDPLGYNSWLDVDFLLLSKASIQSGSFTTALLFLESASSPGTLTGKLDLYDPTVQSIMYEIYSNIEDPDGFYGIKTRDVETALHRQLEHEGDHWRLLGLHGAILSSESHGPTANHALSSTAHAFHQLGFDRIARGMNDSVRSEAMPGTRMQPFALDLAWKTSDWDLPLDAGAAVTSEGLLYSALRSVHRERDRGTAKAVVDKAVQVEIANLRLLGMERMAQMKSITGNLICLRDVANWLSPQTQRALAEGDYASDTLRSFTETRQFTGFRQMERLMSTRQSLFSAAKRQLGQELLGDLTSLQLDGLIAMGKACHLRLGAAARYEGEKQWAMNAVTAVRALERGTARSQEADDEFSYVLWSQGEHQLAIQLVEGMVKTGARENGRQAILLNRIAKWTADAKLKSPADIQGIFHQAYSISTTHKISAVEQAKLCHDYATFANEHFASLARSSELERLYAYVERKRAEIGSTLAPPPPPRKKRDSAKTAATQAQHDLEEDQRAIAELLAEQTIYVKTALRMYAAALMLSDEHDDSITRLCSLWLQHEGNEDINLGVAAALDRVPPHKFIFLGPQLAARLDRPKKPTAFNTSLNALMLRISRQHPFHILYQIITLATGIALPSTSRRLSDSGAEGRGPAAMSIMATLGADSDALLARSAAKGMKRFADAASTWSLHKEAGRDEASWAGRDVTLPAGCPLAALQGISIPIPTSPPPIDLVSNYAGVPTLTRYRSRYSVLGGLHRPKKMYAMDSLQKIHAQLFKGEDEVRQDAVMEQVFEMSNKFLSRDRKTKARHLRFRTYVVIPLAKKTGVLEFVGDSQGIGEWLKPAHARYGAGTGDMKSHKFLQVLKPIQQKDETSRDLVTQFTKMMQGFRPVMRHFFTERHRDPMAWFAMRLSYIRSAAVTSMVGWILGIGDRHCSNIMIDCITGELVHIDFGIVFEEGRRLRIPEKVPFRLTNDIVDGLGITGVDGTFRRCSEQTLRVLRESSDLIMTVLEVFKHDPLYAWTGDPDKLQRAQGGGKVDLAQSATVQEKADRVLSRIRQKLRDDLSVEYRVNQLIQEARDVESLAKIFVGWQAWF